MLSAGGLIAYERMKPPKLEDHSHREGSHAQAEDDQVPSANVGPKALSHYEDMSVPVEGAPSDSTMKQIRQNVKAKHWKHASDFPIPESVKQLANGGEGVVKEQLGLWEGVVSTFDDAMSYLFPADKPSLDVKASA